jgi:hypothetical protein
MGGVDLPDPISVMCCTIREQLKKYYQKIVYCLLDLTLLNSSVIYRKNSSISMHSQIHMEIIQKLF